MTHPANPECVKNYISIVSRTFRYVYDRIVGSEQTSRAHWSQLLLHPELVVEYLRDCTTVQSLVFSRNKTDRFVIFCFRSHHECGQTKTTEITFFKALLPVYDKLTSILVYRDPPRRSPETPTAICSVG